MSSRRFEATVVVLTADSETELAEAERDLVLQTHVDGHEVALLSAPHQRVYLVASRTP